MSDWPTRHDQERAEWQAETACSATDLESSLLRDIELLRQHHGALHPELIERRNCLAGLHELAGRTDEALALYRDHLNDLMEQLGPDDPATQQTRALYEQALSGRSVPVASDVPTVAEIITSDAAPDLEPLPTGLLIVPCPPRQAVGPAALNSLRTQLQTRHGGLRLRELPLGDANFEALMSSWPALLAQDPDALVLPRLPSPDLNVADPPTAGTALVSRLVAESKRRLVLIGVEACSMDEAIETLIDWHEPARHNAARRLIERTRIDAADASL